MTPTCGEEQLQAVGGTSDKVKNERKRGLVENSFIFGHIQFSSVHFSHSVVSDSLRPHELQHARPPCPAPTPGLHSDSRPSSP